MASEQLSSQFGNALRASHIDKPPRTGGLYIIRPGWGRDRNLFKVGRTNVIGRRQGNYSQAMPHVAGSVQIVAFLIVAESQQVAREQALKDATSPGFGFTAVHPKDTEWRRYTGNDLGASIRALFSHIRRAVDGRAYVFDDLTGRVEGWFGREAYVQQPNALPIGPVVTLRSQSNRRRLGSVRPDGTAADPSTQNGVHTRLLRPRGPRPPRRISYVGME